MWQPLVSRSTSCSNETTAKMSWTAPSSTSCLSGTTSKTCRTASSSTSCPSGTAPKKHCFQIIFRGRTLQTSVSAIVSSTANLSVITANLLVIVSSTANLSLGDRVNYSKPLGSHRIKYRKPLSQRVPRDRSNTIREEYKVIAKFSSFDVKNLQNLCHFEAKTSTIWGSNSPQFYGQNFCLLDAKTLTFSRSKHLQFRSKDHRHFKTQRQNVRLQSNL